MFAPSLAVSMNKLLDNRAIVTTGLSMRELVLLYLTNNKPVIIWATMDMKPKKDGDKWMVNGVEFTWPAGEHCLLLVGATDTNYILHDPIRGANF